jgi:CBS domain-containing protein
MYTRTVRPVSPSSPVRTVMVWPVATIDSGATLSEVAEALAADEIGALFVLENGGLAGIVSERDVVTHLAAGADPAHLTAGDVMSSELVTVGPDESVLVAARRMQDSQVRHLPVLDHSEIAGILSIRDLFMVLLDAADEPEVVHVHPGATVTVVGD